MGPTERVSISTPGRICLFGEHQDYLHLPVIPAAISLRLTIEGTRRNDLQIRIALPDIQSSVAFSLEEKLEYTSSKDYFRSAVKVLMRHGFTFSSGFACSLRSAIPIQAGTSSSSALVVGWVNFLAQMSDQRVALPAALIARYAYEAEVLEFSEAGGMMDQCAAAYGGVTVIEFLPSLRVERVNVPLGKFVVGDSRQPKDTQAILARVKNRVLNVVQQLSAHHQSFSLAEATEESVRAYQSELSSDDYTLLLGTIRNHAITAEARKVLAAQPFDHQRFADLLTRHHVVLREIQQISTPTIDRMLDAALNAGALGGKINGSGGGGCMFAYAPAQTEQVAEAIERAGGKAYPVSIDAGTRMEI
jgi:galactokinase